MPASAAWCAAWVCWRALVERLENDWVVQEAADAFVSVLPKGWPWLGVPLEGEVASSAQLHGLLSLRQLAEGGQALVGRPGLAAFAHSLGLTWPLRLAEGAAQRLAILLEASGWSRTRLGQVNPMTVGQRWACPMPAAVDVARSHLAWCCVAQLQKAKALWLAGAVVSGQLEAEPLHWISRLGQEAFLVLMSRRNQDAPLLGAE